MNKDETCKARQINRKMKNAETYKNRQTIN